jgi:hypothetical protein
MALSQQILPLDLMGSKHTPYHLVALSHYEYYSSPLNWNKKGGKVKVHEME